MFVTRQELQLSPREEINEEMIKYEKISQNTRNLLFPRI